WLEDKLQAVKLQEVELCSKNGGCRDGVFHPRAGQSLQGDRNRPSRLLPARGRARGGPHRVGGRESTLAAVAGVLPPRRVRRCWPPPRVIGLAGDDQDSGEDEHASGRGLALDRSSPGPRPEQSRQPLVPQDLRSPGLLHELLL